MLIDKIKENLKKIEKNKNAESLNFDFKEKLEIKTIGENKNDKAI